VENYAKFLSGQNSKNTRIYAACFMQNNEIPFQFSKTLK